MNTQRVTASSDQIERAARLLALGELVAFPTETVYGLGCDALNLDAARKVFVAKGRPADNPLIVHLADWEMLSQVSAMPLTPLAARLAERFWPGALTLVVRANGRVPLEVRGGLETVAVRMPSHPVARELIQKLGRPIAAPSANRSGRPSPTDAEAVFEDLAGRIALVLDGGASPLGVESTVIDVTVDPPTLLRPGGISRRDIEEIVGRLAEPTGSGQHRSPGTRYRHYAPKAQVVVISSEDPVVVTSQLQALDRGPGSVAVLARESWLTRLRSPTILSFSLGETVDEGAHYLFQGLRQLDRMHPEYIAVIWNHHQGVGEAVLNRLHKAQGLGNDSMLFVCTGNTCRSAMAEALWNHRYGIFTAHSAGLMAHLGAGAAPAAMKAVSKLGASLAYHRAKTLDSVAQEPRFVLTMTQDQAEAVKRMRPNWAERVWRLTDLVGDPSGDISDPYGGSDQEYEAVAQQLDALLLKLWQVVWGRMSKDS